MIPYASTLMFGVVKNPPPWYPVSPAILTIREGLAVTNERFCDWPGCREGTVDLDADMEKGWFLGGIYKNERQFLPKSLPLKMYNALCPLHHQMLEACREELDQEDC
jgi:hypothetical protein